ncbi:MAG TPA: sigma-54 dependent transcriptional regulator [Candidatus Methylomirabilis sp.]|nr:sigma-54 dependent transcriptional regulator [Candidatus Methylomirabilis sp.]
MLDGEARDSSRVLVVDDDPEIVAVLTELLKKAGHQASAVSTGAAAIAAGKEEPFDVILVDVRLPDMDGLAVLRAVQAVTPEVAVIVMTAFGTVEMAIQAIKAGAYDYVPKPFKLDEVRIAVARALERKRLLAENRKYRQALRGKYRLENVVGASGPMLEIFKTVARVAPTRSTVLLQGESGAGKELIARTLHYNSDRAQAPFVTVDCGALAETLLESELFGHEKGAFTGATSTKRGLFEAARGGTCFLDEIGDISPAVQARLLRVLQEHEIKRVGGTEPIRVDVRVIAATNQNLEALVKAHRFREDLFFRLSVVTLGIPPLRERVPDIPLLADFFLRKFATETGKPVERIGSDALALLCGYPWPGNVRELEHTIERAVILTQNPTLLPQDLPPEMRSEKIVTGGKSSPVLPLREMERRHLLFALERAHGNRKQAAEWLGITRRTLYRMAHRYGIELSAMDD